MKGIALGWAVAAIAAAAATAWAEDTAWVSMYNGKDLDGWTPYFAKKGLANPDSTFQYSPEGYLFVNQRLGKDVTGFGHMFYTKKKLSYYIARAVYRFTSEGAAPGFMPSSDQPQNNGLMIHSQDPKTMNGKDFPTSAECQLLGPKNALFLNPGGGWPVGKTGNLCPNGITVNINGGDFNGGHCEQAQYPQTWKNTKTPWEDSAGWSDMTIRVLGDSLIQHYVHGVKVLEYSRIRSNGAPLKEGYLAIQAEGTPTQFKVLEYVELTGCTDKSKPGYRSYFVKTDNSKCDAVPVAAEGGPAAAPYLARSGRGFAVRGDAVIVEVRRADGTREPLRPGAREFVPDRAGIHWAVLSGPAGRSVQRIAWY
jgi:hypothetical protein